MIGQRLTPGNDADRDALRQSKTETFVSSIEQMRSLSIPEADVLWCLFSLGPTEDMYIPSKQGLDDLCNKELVERAEGWQWLTRQGVMLALGLGMDHRKDKRRGDER
jgi:hypothetical protein